jgi:hypothetical protein
VTNLSGRLADLIKFRHIIFKEIYHCNYFLKDFLMHLINAPRVIRDATFLINISNPQIDQLLLLQIVALSVNRILAEIAHAALPYIVVYAMTTVLSSLSAPQDATNIQEQNCNE